MKALDIILIAAVIIGCALALRRLRRGKGGCGGGCEGCPYGAHCSKSGDKR